MAHRRDQRAPAVLPPALLGALLLAALFSQAAGGFERVSAPPGGLDGYTTGLGLMDVSSDEFYCDAEYRPTHKPGIPVEMKKMIQNAETFHRQTLSNTEAQVHMRAVKFDIPRSR